MALKEESAQQRFDSCLSGMFLAMEVHVPDTLNL